MSLWPHRYDYLWAEHPKPGTKPQWHSESRHPLSDRLFLQGTHLYGVRFASETQYIMLDIDRGSLYHPERDSFALSRIRAAVEELGLIASITCTSSYSGGLHIYFPFEHPQKTWEIALAVTTVLEAKGFQLIPGHLELYPNPRPFSACGEQSLYCGHRLPLQAGSYILNERFEPIASSKSRFVDLWRKSQVKNDVNVQLLRSTIKSSHRKSYRVTCRAEKFLNDLNAEIERGWTAPGMTNRLLGRIAMRSYVFGHVLYAERLLEGPALVQDIVQVARTLPGFYEWSNHVEDLEQRARDWARAVEKSDRYFPYGSTKSNRLVNAASSSDKRLSPYHQQQLLAARERIRLAVATLLEENALPIGVGARFRLLSVRFHIGGTTLYKHKDLWHPEHLTAQLEQEANSSGTNFSGTNFSADNQAVAADAALSSAVEIPPIPPCFKEKSGLDCYNASSPDSSPSLLEPSLGNSLAEPGLSPWKPAMNDSQWCNSEADGENGPVSPVAAVKAVLKQIRVRRQQHRERRREGQVRQQRQRTQLAQQTQCERLYQYLASGDPILVAEAVAAMSSP